MAGSFVILRFGEPATSDVVYIESQAGDLFLESETDLSRFRAIFEHLRALALPPDASGCAGSRPCEPWSTKRSGDIFSVTRISILSHGV